MRNICRGKSRHPGQKKGREGGEDGVTVQRRDERGTERVVDAKIESSVQHHPHQSRNEVRIESLYPLYFTNLKRNEGEKMWKRGKEKKARKGAKVDFSACIFLCLLSSRFFCPTPKAARSISSQTKQTKKGGEGGAEEGEEGVGVPQSNSCIFSCLLASRFFYPAPKAREKSQRGK